MLLLIVVCGVSSYECYQLGKRAGAKEGQYQVKAQQCAVFNWTLNESGACIDNVRRVIDMTDPQAKP